MTTIPGDLVICFQCKGTMRKEYLEDGQRYNRDSKRTMREQFLESKGYVLVCNICNIRIPMGGGHIIDGRTRIS